MHALKLTSIGNAVGLILPKEALLKLGRGEGDTVYLTETPQGLLLTAYDPAIREQLEAGYEFIGDYRDTLQALAE